MNRSIRVLIVALAAASVLGAAFAASATVSGSNGGAGGIIAQAMRATRVSLLAAAPGTGTAPIATVRASDLARAVASGSLARTLYARLSLDGQSFAFAADHTAAAHGRLVLRVSGAPGATVPHLAPLSVVATDLFEASQGDQPAVLLTRGTGPGAVTFALYDPSMGTADASMGVAGADRATVWVNGAVRTYPVLARGGGVGDLVIASGSRKGAALPAVVGGGIVAAAPQASPSTARAADRVGQGSAVAAGAGTLAMAPHANLDQGMHGDIIGYQTSNGRELE